MFLSRRCLHRPVNVICLGFVLITILQVYLDMKRTEILSQSNLNRGMDSEKQWWKPVDVVKEQEIGSNADSDTSRDPMSHQTHNKSMESYLKSYPLRLHKACSHIERPRLDSIYRYKNVYQHFKLTPRDYPTTDAYFLAFYYDDRFIDTGAKYIRTFVTIKGIGPERQASKELIQKTAKWSGVINDTPTSALLWYAGFRHPVSASCRTAPAFGITRNVSNQFYYEYIITCALPEIDLLPTHVSISQQYCSTPVNYVTVTYPRPARSVGHRDIGVCMASLYGTMNATDIPYFVSWMEALSIYGVIEVNLNNALMQIDAPLQRVLDYYVARGRLILTHYPVIHETWRDHEQDQATESTNKMHVGHCFFRNIKRYWHTLVIDLDELPVPLREPTYADALDAVSTHNASLANAHCHTIRSAFFYFDFPPGNADAPRYLPLHRYTRRFRTEPAVFGHNDGLGLGKSFHNTRRVVAMGHHLCRSSHRELGVHLLKQSFIDESRMLIHHYRKQCKYTVDCQNSNKTVDDNHIPAVIGSELRRRVEQVLHHNHYPMSN